MSNEAAINQFLTQQKEIAQLAFKRALDANEYHAHKIHMVTALTHKSVILDLKSLLGDFSYPDPKEVK